MSTEPFNATEEDASSSVEPFIEWSEEDGLSCLSNIRLLSLFRVFFSVKRFLRKLNCIKLRIKWFIAKKLNCVLVGCSNAAWFNYF